MAHFAILCPDEAGHVLSIGPVGKELVRRGHRVTLLAQARAAPLAEELGLPLRELIWTTFRSRSSYCLGWAFRLWGAAEQVGLREWFRWQAEAVLQLVPPLLKELSVDGLIVDHVVSAGGTAAELAGIPFVTISSALLWNEEPSVPPAYTSWPYSQGRWAEWRNRLGFAGWHWFNRPIINVINRYRSRSNLAPFHRIDDTFPRWRKSLNCVGDLISHARNCPIFFTTSGR